MFKWISVLMLFCLVEPSYANHPPRAIHCAFEALGGVSVAKDLDIGLDGLTFNRIQLGRPLESVTLVMLALPYKDNRPVHLGVHDRVLMILLDDEYGYASPADRCSGLGSQFEEELNRFRPLLPQEIQEELDTALAAAEITPSNPIWSHKFNLCSDSSYMVTVKIDCYERSPNL